MGTVHDVLQRVIDLYESIIYHWKDTLGCRAFDVGAKDFRVYRLLRRRALEGT